MTVLRLIFFYSVVTTSMVCFANHNLQLETKRLAKNGNSNLLEEHNLDVTKVQPEQKNSDEIPERFYPYTQSGSPRAGILLEATDISSSKAFFGLSYMLPSKQSPHWEVSFDMSTQSLAFLSVNRRTIFDERRSFRPYYKWGVANIINSEYKLASLVELKNYQLKMGLGIEDLLTPPMSVRLEAEVGVGLENIYLLISLGYSWGW